MHGLSCWIDSYLEAAFEPLHYWTMWLYEPRLNRYEMIQYHPMRSFFVEKKSYRRVRNLERTVVGLPSADDPRASVWDRQEVCQRLVLESSHRERTWWQGKRSRRAASEQSSKSKRQCWVPFRQGRLVLVETTQKFFLTLKLRTRLHSCFYIGVRKWPARVTFTLIILILYRTWNVFIPQSSADKAVLNGRLSRWQYRPRQALLADKPCSLAWRGFSEGHSVCVFLLRHVIHFSLKGQTKQK